MYDKEINISEIMREIKERVIPIDELEDFEESCATDIIGREIQKIKYTHDYIENIQENMKPYLNTGQRLPLFTRFPWPIRKMLRLIAKIMARCTRFITIEQNMVNQNLLEIIHNLMENEKELITMIRYLNNKEESERLDNSNSKDNAINNR